MLMPRLQLPNAFSTEMSIAMSMQQQQQQHINQLLSTAAAGIGIVGDVDALLTPIHPRPERNLWRTEEVLQMLNIMQSIGAVRMLNDKTVKSDMVFRRVEKLMHHSGYRKKSQLQIWTKWKFLKSTYTTTKRNGTIPKMIPPRVYYMLHTMLDSVTSSGGAGAGGGADTSECGNSIASLDGDSSNGAGGGRIVISGVEGGYTSSNNQGTVDSDDENAFGMAHPIFGFRLGLVKQEPADAGYETVSGVDKDPLEENIVPTSTACSTSNIQFQTVIKQEADDTSGTPPPQQQSPTSQATIAELAEKQQPIHSTPEILMIKRPARITTAVVPAPTITTTTAPTSQIPVQKSQQRLQQPTDSADKSRPPIRIAPFAKVASENAMTSIALPPPPLHAAPGAVRPIRLNSVHSAAHMSLNGKPALRPVQPMAGIRLPKDITVQSRPVSATSAMQSYMPRLKQVPTRKTPYSLRPERLIPDLDSTPSTSPPEVPPVPHYVNPNIYTDGPSTSQQALRLNNGPPRRLPVSPVASKRRRLDIPWSESVSKLPTKMTRVLPNANATSTPRLPAYNKAEAEERDEESSEDGSFQSSTAQQQRDDAKSHRTARHEQEYFDNALKDLSTSLRQMQREMINEFFKQQMDMAHKEHQFQMRQDVLIMQAFMEQSKNFMKMAKRLMSDKHDETEDSREEQKKQNEGSTRKQQKGKAAEIVNVINANANAAQEHLEAGMRTAARKKHAAEMSEDEEGEDGNGDENGNQCGDGNGDEREHEHDDYEDDEYLHDNSGDMNDTDVTGSADEDDDADAEASNATASVRGDDEADPTQMVSSELNEDI